MKPTILVADDEPSIVLSLQVLLQKAGFAVRIARNGEEALESVAESTPDLILLDAMMPRRDGFDVCQSLRANPAYQSLPIIMLTAKSRDVERQKGMALGATDYITKPFSTRDLVTTVRKYLNPESNQGGTQGGTAEPQP
ncbi:response regulator [Azospirillum brasilense]|uniref:Response regulator n=1 Tax=Azospirillum brasilense TaxID=192 RepID=A0A0P0F5D5_AZOBR|nr:MULTISPECIES: response regulator [Azospirillum]ALJ34372.1 two-component system response regulator [Azospirillum brasilense]MDW7556383.1 response regulator [Azospirillum brasilense]MDW7596205.1 response regulator [Azospirillum brasilense]MDW7631146.1 response regulator [Azospirillum brasilense]MDX5952983.1 response regulator [Azospirillum brasilense]